MEVEFSVFVIIELKTITLLFIPKLLDNFSEAKRGVLANQLELNYASKFTLKSCSLKDNISQ